MLCLVKLARVRRGSSRVLCLWLGLHLALQPRSAATRPAAAAGGEEAPAARHVAPALFSAVSAGAFAADGTRATTGGRARVPRVWEGVPDRPDAGQPQELPLRRHGTIGDAAEPTRAGQPQWKAWDREGLPHREGAWRAGLRGSALALGFPHPRARVSRPESLCFTAALSWARGSAAALPTVSPATGAPAARRARVHDAAAANDPPCSLASRWRRWRCRVAFRGVRRQLGD